jgi:hypothetical protein
MIFFYFYLFVVVFCCQVLIKFRGLVLQLVKATVVVMGTQATVASGVAYRNYWDFETSETNIRNENDKTMTGRVVVTKTREIEVGTGGWVVESDPARLVPNRLHYFLEEM